MATSKRQTAPIRIPVLLARLQAHALGKGELLTASQLRAIEILIRQCHADEPAATRAKEGERDEIRVRVEPYVAKRPAVGA